MDYRELAGTFEYQELAELAGKAPVDITMLVASACISLDTHIRYVSTRAAVAQAIQNGCLSTVAHPEAVHNVRYIGNMLILEYKGTFYRENVTHIVKLRDRLLSLLEKNKRAEIK